MKVSYQGDYRNIDSLRVSRAGAFLPVAKLFQATGGKWDEVIYGGADCVFDGESAVQQVVIDGAVYDMYALTTSGVMKLKKSAKVFLVGGGASGSKTTGNGGPGGFVNEGEILKGNYAIEIGAGGTDGTSGTATKLKQNGEDILVAEGGVVDGTGGSGYGAGGKGTSNGTGGKGDGKTTKPFGIATQPAHSAAGSGGDYKYSSTDVTGYKGGPGGSDGSDGGTPTQQPIQSLLTGGTSAERGGGKGGGAYWTGTGAYDGTDATFHGSGGGGPGHSASFGAPGDGYQGVAYIAVPSTYRGIVIAKQPESVSCSLNDSVTFSVEAVNVTAYRWQYSPDDGATWSGLFWDGAYSDTITFDVSSTTRASNLYRCELKNDIETLYTDVVTITI